MRAAACAFILSLISQSSQFSSAYSCTLLSPPASIESGFAAAIESELQLNNKPAQPSAKNPQAVGRAATIGKIDQIIQQAKQKLEDNGDIESILFEMSEYWHGTNNRVLSVKGGIKKLAEKAGKAQTVKKAQEFSSFLDELRYRYINEYMLGLAERDPLKAIAEISKILDSPQLFEAEHLAELRDLRNMCRQEYVKVIIDKRHQKDLHSVIEDNIVELKLGPEECFFVGNYNELSKSGINITMARLAQKYVVKFKTNQEVEEFSKMIAEVRAKIIGFLSDKNAFIIKNDSLAKSEEAAALKEITVSSIAKTIREKPEIQTYRNLIDEYVRATGSDENGVLKRISGELGYTAGIFSENKRNSYGQSLVLGGVNVFATGKANINKVKNHSLLDNLVSKLEDFVKSPDSRSFAQVGKLVHVKRIILKDGYRCYLRYYKEDKKIVILDLAAKGDIARNESSGALNTKEQDFLAKFNKMHKFENFAEEGISLQTIQYSGNQTISLYDGIRKSL